MIGIAAVLVALLGVPAGMFANLLIDRIPEKQPLWPLPAVGSLFGGRRHGLVVVATAALFAGTVLRFRGDWVVPAYLVFFVSLVAITVIDFQLQIIPNRIVYPTIFAAVPLLALAALAGHQWDRFGHALLGASLAWVALLVVHLISPAGMGFGDVRLSFVLGLFLGWISLGHVVTGLFLGILLICAAGLILAILRLRSLQDHIAFGPFLAAGSAIAVFAGQPIMRWWLGG
jgi:leader peptidase (prepilin peptidase)/N-methyltransferase